MNLYTRWVERDGGVYVQVEFLALSRSIPAFFAPLVNRYVHSIPREYLKRYLETTRKALSSTESRVSFEDKPGVARSSLSAGPMGVGGLLPLQEVGPSIFRWESRRRLPNRDGEGELWQQQHNWRR